MVSLTPALSAHLASRFGLGGRPDQPLCGDPMAWLTQQLASAPAVSGPSLDTCMAALAALHVPPGSPAATAAGNALHTLFAAEQQAYMMQAVTTNTPFLERLVRFFANHFAIQAVTLPTYALAGTFVRDAIRANIGGTFSTMLQAAVQHPAMVCSLNNQLSAGPQSVAARRRGLGFNENLGRETLELFSIGLGANYAQADVDAMAYLLAGVTTNLSSRPYGAFYDPTMAQPGNSTLLGVTFPNTQAGCASALAMLGKHPCTYAHIATKLAVHFISDTPAAADIAAITAALSSTGGSILAAANAVLSCSSAWQPLTKLRTPQDYIIAMMRAANTTCISAANLPSLALSLGQPVWQPPFPNGWSDMAVDWCGPATLDCRFRCAAAFASSLGACNAVTAAAGSVGPLLSANSNAVINAAPTNANKVALLFTSPEFQRR